MNVIIWGKELPPRPYRKSKDIFMDEQEREAELLAIHEASHTCDYDCAKNGCSFN